MAQQSKKKRADPEPPPQDAGTKPVQLQRRRVWRACESCRHVMLFSFHKSFHDIFAFLNRRKKIKCDGCEPTCSQCAASGSQCTWLQTKDRAALSRHYVQELEARLLHMESLFSQIAPVLEQVGQSANGNGQASSSNGKAALPPELASPATEILRSIAQGGQSASPPPKSVKVEDDVSESFGQLALDEYGHARWIGGSSTMSLIQSFRALTTSPMHRISPMEEDPLSPLPSVNKLYFPASVFFGRVRALPGPEEVEYPERDLADKLVHAYFSRLHFLMPVMDKPSFIQQYEHIMNNTHDRELASSQTAFISLIFAVFACAANLVEDDRLKVSGRTDEGGMGMVYYERSLVLQYISHAKIQIPHVQCFLLLSSFLCSINCLPQAWILVGQAVRTGQDLGLHRSPRRLVISPIEKETRRKIWWGVYTLDRMLALALGRPLGIEDADCDVEPPCDVDDDRLPEYFSGANMTPPHLSLMTGYIALTKLYQIAGRVLRQVYALDNCRDHLEPEQKAELQQIVESLDTELTKWCDDLPEAFKSRPETDEQVSMGAVLCSHYYSVLTTLHRNFIPVKRDRDQLVTPKSTMKAVSSARSCIRLAPSMKNVVPPSHHLAFFIQHLFSSAVILLLYAMHTPDTRGASAAMDEAKSSLPALESWEGHWPGARKCRELLLELTNTAAEAVARGPNESVTTVAPSATTAPLERRSSLSAGTNASAVHSRVTKNRSSRRNDSRDRPSEARSRRMAAVSPYRVDTASARARSSSRRRGHEDSDSIDHGSGPYFHSISSPTTSALPHLPNAGSSHSSPASANVPSPITTVNEAEPSPTMAPAHTFYESPGLSSAQVPSPPRYEFDYNGMQGNPLHFSNTQQWSGQPSDLYSPTSHDNNMPFGADSGFADSFNSFGLPQDMSTSLGALSTSPTSTSFAATGLPFRGLEYLRNYPSDGQPVGDFFMGESQESLWQSYDPTSFEYNPDLPFTLGDPDLHDGLR
ncbi:hypothetical protein VNI00_001082 [Paramarasmius palmivorus]|uniref:Xylanolytic transcriptional activator regulatory domain-containing protein n=1 Tax=Paramarasmius palmivorus TaxID=297713 RepID=A0AAW0E8I5_9AGAR